MDPLVAKDSEDPSMNPDPQPETLSFDQLIAQFDLSVNDLEAESPPEEETSDQIEYPITPGDRMISYVRCPSTGCGRVISPLAQEFNRLVDKEQIRVKAENSKSGIGGRGMTREEYSKFVEALFADWRSRDYIISGSGSKIPVGKALGQHCFVSLREQPVVYGGSRQEVQLRKLHQAQQQARRFSTQPTPLDTSPTLKPLRTATAATGPLPTGIAGTRGGTMVAATGAPPMAVGRTVVRVAGPPAIPAPLIPVTMATKYPVGPKYSSRKPVALSAAVFNDDQPSIPHRPAISLRPVHNPYTFQVTNMAAGVVRYSSNEKAHDLQTLLYSSIKQNASNVEKPQAPAIVRGVAMAHDYPLMPDDSTFELDIPSVELAVHREESAATVEKVIKTGVPAMEVPLLSNLGIPAAIRYYGQ